jgi:glycosyltransferase involved in cell wall biosynthesis
VLRVITRLNAGGPARHVVWLCAGLRAYGYDSRLVIGRPAVGEDDLSDFARESGVEAEQIAALSRSVDPMRDLVALRALYRKIEEFRPEIIHTHTSKAGMLGRLAARHVNRRRLRAGCPPIRVVHTFHGNVLSGYFSPVKSLLFRVIERNLAQRASDAIVVLSPQQREELVVRYGVVPFDRAYVIPLALNLSEFERLPVRGSFRAEIGIGAGDFVFGMVGRIAPIKNHELFLRAAAIAARELPRGRFVVIGGGEGAEELRRIASDLGIGERVRFAGVRTDLPSVYADLDVMALTSRNEGTPLSLIEAMAAGVPVVATDVGGVRDLLTQEWSGDIASRRFGPSARPRGLLVPSEDAEGLAAGLLRLARERALAQSLGEAGRAYAFRHHGLSRLLNDMDRLYGLVLARHESVARTNP